MIDSLIKSHESSLRLFEEHTLKPLTKDDIKYVIDGAKKQIEEKDNTILTIDEEAYNGFVEFSEGYPHFLQQVGYSTISKLDKYHVKFDDVRDAMFNKGGALEMIGNRYYNELFYNRINVDSYRQILEIMADNWNEWISKAEIRKNYSGSGTNLNNGIKALRDRNIILSKEE